MRDKNRKTLVGTVHSDKMNKTISVDVERRVKHAMYGKYLTRSRRFLAHDEKENARTGDLVELAETRPVSKRKRWRLVRVLQRSKSAEKSS